MSNIYSRVCECPEPDDPDADDLSVNHFGQFVCVPCGGLWEPGSWGIVGRRDILRAPNTRH